MKPGLALDQAPPISLPARFFLTAPLFGLAAAALLVADASWILGSRWSPSALAALHLFALGFAGSVMLGAAYQLLPVVAGATPRGGPVAAAFVHASWTSGAVLLPLGLRHGPTALIAVGGSLLFAAAAVFVAGAGLALLRTRTRSDTVTALRLAVVAFGLTVIGGLALALAHAGILPLLRPSLTNAHAAWALAGWMGLLLLGASWVVVPMLQGTPSYPPFLRTRAAPVVFALLLLRTLAAPLGGLAGDVLRGAFEVGIVAVFASYAVVTLSLQARRTGRAGDATVACFRVACIAALVAGGAHVAHVVLGDRAAMLGLIAVAAWVVGFIGSAIVGMQLKIVAFVGWLHLSSRVRSGAPSGRVPTMQQIVPPRRARLVALAQGATACLVIAAPAAPLLARLAGIVLAVTMLLLAAALVRAVRTASSGPA